MPQREQGAQRDPDGEREPTQDRGDEGRAARERRHRRRVRWVIGLAVVAGVLGLLRLAAPPVVAARLEARLSARLGASVQVDGVSLGLWAGEMTVHGLHAAPADAKSLSSVRARELRVGWRWFDLFAEPMRLTFDAYGVAAQIDLQAPWPATIGAAEADAGGLESLNWLVVHDAALTLVPGPDAAPVLALHGLRARVYGTSSGIRGPGMSMQARLFAGVGTSGSLVVDGALSPVDPRAAWTLRFALTDLDLRSLNPLVQSALEMDVERGQLSASGELTTSTGRLRGYLLPSFADLTLYRAGEPVRHPMAEAIFGTMLATADQPIEIDRPALTHANAGGMHLGPALSGDAQALLRSIVLNGYTRRLDSLDGLDATIGGLELDMPHGAMAFTDITLRRSSGAVPTLFLHLARLEVTIDASVLQPGVTTYKSVVLRQPRLVLVSGRDADTTIDPDWQAKVSALPFPTERLEIVDGEVEYRDETTSPPSSLGVAEIELTAEHLASARLTAGERAATVTLRAKVAGESPVSAEIRFAPASDQLDGALTLKLDPVQVTAFNGLLRDRFGVDASSGSLGLSVDLAARGGHVTGTVTPALHDVKVLGATETEVSHPLRELLLERRLHGLDGARVPIELDVQPDDGWRTLARGLLSTLRGAQ